MLKSQKAKVGVKRAVCPPRGLKNGVKKVLLTDAIGLT